MLESRFRGLERQHRQRGRELNASRILCGHRRWTPLLLIGLLLVAGCDATQRGEGGIASADQEAAEPVTYAEIREAYNRRTDRIDQMWARAVVEARWTDEQDESHFEQGDGPLIVRKPGELALAVGKLGNYFFWLGSDGERFWVFDLEPPGDQPTTAYIGSHARFADAPRDELPLPIRPDRLVDLLGITSLPAAEAVPSTAAGRLPANGAEPTAPRLPEATLPSAAEGGYDAAYALPGPDDEPADYGILLVLDEQHRPRRMGLLPLRGRSLETALDGASASAFEMIAELSDYARLEQEGKGLGRQPQVPSRIEVTLPGREAELKLSLSDMTDGRRRDKISDVQFDLERLLKIHDPERVRELRSGATADSEPAAKPAESQ